MEARDLADITDRHDSAESTDPAEPNDPIEPMDAMQPMEPTDSADPTEPIESTEPRLPMDRIELVEPMDRIERSDAMPHDPPPPPASATGGGPVRLAPRVTAPAPSGRDRPVSMGRVLVGSAIAVGLVMALGAAMFPVRSHLSIATTALVLVIPVVVGVAVGGFVTGSVGVVCGFLVYDWVFIPPYYTLSVGASENWVALGVYVVVMLVVARVVARLDVARTEAQRRARDVRRLFDMSELLVGEQSLPELVQSTVMSMRVAFDLAGVALLLPVDDRLRLVASSGEPLSEAEVARLSTRDGGPVTMEPALAGPGDVRAMALTVSGRPTGLLALRGLSTAAPDRELLRAFANHLALALERAQLREQAVRAAFLEEVDRARRSLVGAVSHDLRTPLSTIKLSASTLLDPDADLSDGDAKELLRLVDEQADRLDRLVANLLDMTRIQAGALELRREPTPFAGLITAAVEILGPTVAAGRVTVAVPDDLPAVDVDPILIRQVLVNLVDNAARYSPEDEPVDVTMRATTRNRVEVAVMDRGPGVPAGDRVEIFQMANRREAGGRGGLGLGIAAAFLDAHGERIWVEDRPGGGARFVFTLPAAPPATVEPGPAKEPSTATEPPAATEPPTAAEPTTAPEAHPSSGPA
jgi:two-component system sensor histidine kinase KdpD